MNSFDMAKRHTCSLCDRAFDRKYNLKRHENTVHAQFEAFNLETDENEDSEIDENDSEMNDSKNENDGESSEVEVFSHDLEDNLAYQEWYEQAMQATEEKRAENTKNISTRVWMKRKLKKRLTKRPCGWLNASSLTSTCRFCNLIFI